MTDQEPLAAEALHSLLAATLASLPDFVGIASPDGRVLFINPAGRRLVGIAPDADVTQLRTEHLFPPASLSVLRDKALPAAMRDGHWNGETNLRTLSGEEILVCADIVMHGGEHGQPFHFAAVMRDVRPRERAEEALRDSHDVLERERTFLAAVLENLSDGVVACDADGGLTLFNLATREFHGLPVARIPSEEWARHYALYHSDGQTPLERDEVPLFRALKGEEVRDAEMVIAPRDRPARSLRANGRPLRASDGTITGAVVVMRDVTDTRRLEAQLRQAQKMEAVGQLAGGVAHDFNNLLTAISFSVEFLRAELPSEHPLRADVDQIGEAAERAATLTSQLLAFGRRQMLQPKPVNLNDSVASVMRMLPRLIRADIRLRSSSDSRDAWTIVDPGQLEQVIVNLILNARDALPDGGEILVATHVVALQTQVVHPHGVIRAGQYAVVSVSDNGSGMDDATLTRLFEPFFTTKERGKGTGLGLATVHGIVEQSGGSVVVSSMQNKGTTFAVYFPLHAHAEDGASNANADPRSVAALPTILLVDDEALVLRLGERMLAGAGYAVVTAADGETALELLANGGVRSPFVLVTDVTMPGMNGRELAEVVADRYEPDGTLFISGFTADQQFSDGTSGASLRLLTKPFSAAQLLDAVRQATGAR